MGPLVNPSTRPSSGLGFQMSQKKSDLGQLGGTPVILKIQDGHTDGEEAES